MNTLQNTIAVENGIRQETFEEAARRWMKQYEEARAQVRESELEIKDLTIRAQNAERACDALVDAATMLCTQFIQGIRDGVTKKHQYQ